MRTTEEQHNERKREMMEKCFECYADATVIIGLKQNPTHGRRFSPVFFA